MSGVGWTSKRRQPISTDQISMATLGMCGCALSEYVRRNDYVCSLPTNIMNLDVKEWETAWESVREAADSIAANEKRRKAVSEHQSA